MQYALVKSQNAVTRVSVLLNGVLTEPPLTGSDLRREYGRYFLLPPTIGSYTLVVTAADDCGHEVGVDRPMTVQVK